ncbi:MAG: GntR family transcriptional regulator [Chloroflexi bacterium]|jgi:GntR family transcriptional regulator|nr:GntR family transcriptional regulator [Chloroflexota bacterium]NLE92521.1 GntR family transcriptional regulator [Chloroflexota bacterium]
MQIEYDNTKPIYLQIMRLLNYKIVRGEYKPGDKLPSWVDAGLMFNVNHNTIARTYLAMSMEGIVNTRRGEGTFVTEDQSILDELHERMKQELLQDFVSEMNRLGYSLSEISKTLDEYIDGMTESIQK